MYCLVSNEARVVVMPVRDGKDGPDQRQILIIQVKIPENMVFLWFSVCCKASCGVSVSIYEHKNPNPLIYESHEKQLFFHCKVAAASPRAYATPSHSSFTNRANEANIFLTPTLSKFTVTSKSLAPSLIFSTTPAPNFVLTTRSPTL